MEIASLVIGILSLAVTVWLYFLVRNESRKAERRNELIMAVIENGLMELIPDDGPASRTLQPFVSEGYVALMNRANGVRYYSVVSKDGTVILSSMGVGRAIELLRTPIDIKWS